MWLVRSMVAFFALLEGNRNFRRQQVERHSNAPHADWQMASEAEAARIRSSSWGGGGEREPGRKPELVSGLFTLNQPAE